MKFWPYTSIDNFYSNSHKMRSHFEDVFSSPREADPRRFCFDPWYVEDQFSHLKTPAGSFFPSSLIDPFFAHLINWGRTHLGCQMISPPWASLYLDGHYQNWHADNHQGPFAFVYSLTPKWKTTQGGRTLLLKPEILNYWNKSSFDRGLEQQDVYSSIMIKWNRLLVFDPRIPHRVEKVKQVFDPLMGRLVLHGWFVDPRPQIEGALRENQLRSFLNDFIYNCLETMNDTNQVKGYICFRIFILGSGKIRRVETLTSTLIFQDGSKSKADRWEKALNLKLSAFKFKPAKGPTTLTLPLQFS